MPSIDMASRCPICSEPGDWRNTRGGPKGSSVRNYFCVNARCRWFDTSWIVQVSADGTIPERKAGQKDFAKLTPGEESMARMVIEDALQAEKRAQ